MLQILPVSQVCIGRKWQQLTTRTVKLIATEKLTGTQWFGLPHVSQIISQFNGLVNDIVVYYTHVCKQRHMLLVPEICPSQVCLYDSESPSRAASLFPQIKQKRDFFTKASYMGVKSLHGSKTNAQFVTWAYLKRRAFLCTYANRYSIPALFVLQIY